MSGRGQPFEKKVVDERWEATISVKGAKHIRIANEQGYFDAQPVFKDNKLAELNVSADTLEKLKLRIHAHVELLEED